VGKGSQPAANHKATHSVSSALSPPDEVAQTATITDLHQLASVRSTSNEMALVGIARDLAPADLKAVRTGISAELRRLYSDVLCEEIPAGWRSCEASPGGQDTDDA
jgi:hypothetical protein